MDWVLGNDAGSYIQEDGSIGPSLAGAKGFATKEDAETYRRGRGRLAGFHIYGPHSEEEPENRKCRFCRGDETAYACDCV